MDIAAASTATSLSSVAQNVNLSVLKAVENLDSNVGALLAASIGLGTGIDAYA